ncbi:VOC family protein [Hyphococcus sp. DH-69]|uniref:VOC family protein n=1 Tax=Hyphococcus formosus TaxID=3143534 RepID=UPI00398B84ED
MITSFAYATIYVTDPDRAKDFYTEKLGFTLLEDQEWDGNRWLTVAPPGEGKTTISLVSVAQSPVMTDEDVDALKKLVSRGVLGAGVFITDDCHADYQALRDKGVEFTQEPAKQPWGIQAMLKDDSGNWLTLVEPVSTEE